MSEFTEHVREAMTRFGQVEMRRMFGGYGVYHNAVMFGLIEKDTLYLKADADTVAYFKARELTPFAYRQRGRTVELSYYMAPPEVLEDPDDAVAWARRAYDAAIRAKAAATRRGKISKTRETRRRKPGLLGGAT